MWQKCHIFCAEIIRHYPLLVNRGNTYFALFVVCYSQDMNTDFALWKPHLRASHLGAWRTLGRLGQVGAIPGVEWSKRMTKTAGVALLEDGKIRLSSPLFWQYPEGFIVEIVPHELAHIAAFRIFGDNGHGQGWRQCMQALGLDHPGARCWSVERMLKHRRDFNKGL